MNEDLRRKLAFVAPERRQLVEERLEAIAEYCSLDQPTTRQTGEAAARMGLTMAGFYRLVSVWRRSGDPAVLDGTAGPRSGPRPSRHDDEAFIRTTIDALPPGRTVERDVEDVLLAAEREGRKVRGRSTLRRFITELRATRAASDPGLSGVVIDHAALVMPVEGTDGLPVMPVATLVVDIDRRTILDVRLALDQVSAASTLAALGHAATRGAFVPDPTAPSDLTYVRGIGRDWDEAERHLLDLGIRARGSRFGTVRGGLTGSIVIPTLLGLRTRPGIVFLPPDRRPAKSKKHDRVLPLQVAQELIDERMSLSPPVGPTPFSSDPASLYRLCG